MSLPKLNQRNDNGWMTEVLNVLKPGMILYGYCCGYFGRDSYDDKTISNIRIVNPEYGESHIYLEVVENGAINSTTLNNTSEVESIINSSNSWLADQEEQARERDNES